MDIFLNRGEWSNIVGCYLRSSWYANIEKIPCPKWQINYINIHQNHSKIKKGYKAPFCVLFGEGSHEKQFNIF